MPTVREATFRVFEHFSIDAIFGNPGSTELPMMRDLPSGIRYVLGLQESVAIGMADGYAQATRRPALVNLHSAAGTGHAMGNIFTAFKNQTPLVITAGQQARSILPYDPFLNSYRATELPRPYVKWTCEPARAEDVPAAMIHAFLVAMTPPCGPTFVSVPVDDWDVECAMPDIPALMAGQSVPLGAVDRIADAFDRAKSPALVLGAGVARTGGWSAAIALAECSGAAVWVAPFAAREVFPEDHPQFAGFLLPRREAIVETLSGHDLILVIGAPAFTYHVEGSGPHWPEHATLFLISDDPEHSAALPGGTGIVADPAALVAAVVKRIAKRATTASALIRKPPSKTMTDAWLLHRIAALRPARSIIVEEAPSSRDAMHEHLPITYENGFYTCASGGLGHGLPAAIGVAMARRAERTIAILGDGSAMYAIQGLFSAAKLDVPVSFIIVNNRRYEALKFFGRHFGLQQVEGTDLTGIDFVALAQGQGVSAERVSEIDALDAALERSFAKPGPSLVDVIVD
jgi:benzoylformate decarboxylase